MVSSGIDLRNREMEKGQNDRNFVPFVVRKLADDTL